jgi:tetratricopeptide (TPR) repeat protein
MKGITGAVELADQLGDAILAGYAQTWKAVIHHVHMESRDAVESGLRGAEVMRGAGDLWQLSTVLAAVTFSSPGLGQFAATRRLAAEVDSLADRLGNHAASMMAGRGRAMADWAETGDLTGLDAFARRDMDLCENAGLPWISWSWSWLAVAAFHRGDWDGAIRHAKRADALAPPSVIHGAEWALHLEYCGYSGRREEALTMIAAHRDELPRVGQPSGWGAWARLWGVLETLIVLGDLDGAAELYPLVAWCCRRTGSVTLMQPDCRLLERAAGMAAAAASNWDAAENHFLSALHQAEHLPHRPEQAHTRRFYAAMLLRRARPGDRDRARGLLTEAEALYTAMGMPKHVELSRVMHTEQPAL